MALNINPEAARLNDWEYHPTVMSLLAIATAAPMGLIPASFALTATQFTNFEIGDDGLGNPFKPSIVIDTVGSGRVLIIPCITAASYTDLKFQLIGWTWSRPADRWIGTAINHFASARANMAVMQFSGAGITHPAAGATVFKPMERIGVTTAADPDGGLGIVPLPKQYEILPVEGLVSSATTSHASPCTIVVNNYGWKYISLHLQVGVSPNASVSAMCLYRRDNGAFK